MREGIVKNLLENMWLENVVDAMSHDGDYRLQTVQAQEYPKPVRDCIVAQAFPYRSQHVRKRAGQIGFQSGGNSQ